MIAPSLLHSGKPSPAFGIASYCLCAVPSIVCVFDSCKGFMPELSTCAVIFCSCCACLLSMANGFINLAWSTRSNRSTTSCLIVSYYSKATACRYELALAGSAKQRMSAASCAKLSCSTFWFTASNARSKLSALSLHCLASSMCPVRPLACSNCSLPSLRLSLTRSSAQSEHSWQRLSNYWHKPSNCESRSSNFDYSLWPKSSNARIMSLSALSMSFRRCCRSVSQCW